ncbi:MAG: C-terminal binding protein [Rhodobacteraceae bacterium]|nr:MAG: C-terminal binding protein [Paracoccaceae bacterium]
MSQHVVITDATFPDVAAERQAAEAGGATFQRHSCKDAGEVAEAVRGADVVVVQFAPFTREAAQNMAEGGRVIRYGVGYNNIDIDALAERNLTAAYVPDYCTDEVSDHTAALALALLRKLPAFDRSVRSGDWDTQGVAKSMPPFSETVVGFLGFGRIARAVASRLSSFGMKIVAHDPFLKGDGRPNVELVSERDLLARSDVLSLNAPATEDTLHFLNANRLAQMKPTAIVVNTARGDLIDEHALAEALEKGTIAGAGLDVFEEEPLSPTSPLRSAPNLLLSPHAAWFSNAAVARLQGLVADEISRALKGEPARQPIPGTPQPQLADQA